MEETIGYEALFSPLEAKNWSFVSHTLTNVAMEAMTLAEKAQDGGGELDPVTTLGKRSSRGDGGRGPSPLLSD